MLTSGLEGGVSSVGIRVVIGGANDERRQDPLSSKAFASADRGGVIATRILMATSAGRMWVPSQYSLLRTKR